MVCVFTDHPTNKNFSFCEDTDRGLDHPTFGLRDTDRGLSFPYSDKKRLSSALSECVQNQSRSGGTVNR